MAQPANRNLAAQAVTAIGVGVAAVYGASIPPPAAFSVGISYQHGMTSMTAVTESLMNARLGEERAKTDSQFERLLAKMDTFAVRLDAIVSSVGDVKTTVTEVGSKASSYRLQVILAILASAGAAVAISLAVIGYGHQVADTISAAYSNGFAASQVNNNANPQSSPRKR